MKRFILVALLLLSTTAEARIYIPVNQPSDQKFPIAICDLNGGGKFGEEIAEIIRNDLNLSGYFNVLPTEVFKRHAREEGVTLESIQFSYWASIESQAIVKGQVEQASGKFVVTLRLFDPFAPEMIVGKQYKAKTSDVREIAHRFSDEIMESLTGMRGVFNTHISYASVTGKRSKEIFIMDMDGARPRQITNKKTISISPAWSPKGDKIIFTSYMNGAPDLYTMSIDGKGIKQITSGPGAKLTPTWSPSGDAIVFSSSASGEADLYATTSDGKKTHRLTSALGIDLAPAFSPDGSEIVFASERAGNLHLFKMPVTGGDAQRLTFVGYQNDMPSWSPMADKIAFAGRDLGTFDIFIMNPDGSNIQRLTIAAGSNERPTFSPDGRFIAFSSTRDGGPAIYVMRADGSNQTKISKGNGVLPKWGPRVE